MIELTPLPVGCYLTVYNWTERYPWPAEIEGFEEWKLVMSTRLTAAIFENSELLAVLSFDQLGNGILQLHIDAPSADVLELNAVITAALSVERQLFEDESTQWIVGWTPAANKGVVELAGKCGLKWDGVEMFNGKRRWVRLGITREEYEQQKQTEYNYHPEYHSEPKRHSVGAVQ